jgi:predicted porin
LLSLGSPWAAAQTSVTLYGVIDVNVGRYKGAAAGVNQQSSATWRSDAGGMSTSHIGIRGSEDLGGGLSASFDISGFLRNDIGASGRSDAIGAPVNVAADPLWSRSSWVGIGSANLGRVRLGNATTLLFINAITSNAFGDSTAFSPLNLVTFIGSPLSGGTGWTNSIVYDSPVLSGFSASVARSLSEQQGGPNSAVRAAYSQGPLALSFALQDVKRDPLTFADGTSPNNTRSWQLAAAYDFGVVKVFGHFGRIANRGTESAPADVNYRIWELSASMPLGAGRVLAGYATRKTSDTPGPLPATAAGGNIMRAVFTLGYDHHLSKRTDMYAMVMHDNTETRTLPAPPTVEKASGTNFGVGIRHRF